MTAFLLDTHVLIWSLFNSRRLPAPVLELIGASEHSIQFSAVSIWEIAVKRSLNRPDFMVDPHDALSSAAALGFVELPLKGEVSARVTDLPWHHRDPFDRLIVAQAMMEPARLLTADRHLARYSELVTVVNPVRSS